MTLKAEAGKIQGSGGEKQQHNSVKIERGAEASRNALETKTGTRKNMAQKKRKDGTSGSKKFAPAIFHWVEAKKTKMLPVIKKSREWNRESERGPTFG